MYRFSSRHWIMTSFQPFNGNDLSREKVPLLSGAKQAQQHNTQAFNTFLVLSNEDVLLPGFGFLKSPKMGAER